MYPSSTIQVYIGDSCGNLTFVEITQLSFASLDHWVTKYENLEKFDSSILSCVKFTTVNVLIGTNRGDLHIYNTQS